MKLTDKRLSRYLKLQKQVNNYFLKLTTKERDKKIKLLEVTQNGLKLEEQIRKLREFIANGK